MFSIQLKCPHCGKDEKFEVLSPTQYFARDLAPDGSVTAQRSVRANSYTDQTVIQAYGLSSCRWCNGPVLVWFECKHGELERIRQAAREETQWRYIGAEPKILATYPQPVLPDDSPHYPEKLRAVFIELQEDVKAGRTAARIVVGCRSVMEVALAEQGLTDGNLLSRIDTARDKGILTEGMRQWAHKVRLAGNEATHELEARTDEARELVDFIRLFLEVVFVLPERIKKATGTQHA